MVRRAVASGITGKLTFHSARPIIAPRSGGTSRVPSMAGGFLEVIGKGEGQEWESGRGRGDWMGGSENQGPKPT